MAEEAKTESTECCTPEDKHWHHKHHKHHGRHGTVVAGPIWLIGWLFTIGFCHMPFFWKGVLALFIWPFYLGNILH